jgi:predicted RecB family nuclease
MQQLHGTRLYSAKDLITFLGCEHSTALDLRQLVGDVAAPADDDDAYLDLLKQKGNEHERRYLESLRAEGKSIREIDRDAPLDVQAEATREAMRDGVDVIYQGALVSRPWHGYSDFLLRTHTPSNLGAYSYEVADTKLARSAKPKHVVQLCLYSQLVALEQDLLPTNMHVLLGDGAKLTLKLQDYVYYVRVASERFLEFASATDRHTEAEPCAHCDLCRWNERCDAEWEAADHLSIVARLSGSQRKKLVAAGVTNLRELAQLKDDATVPKIQPETLDRLRSQARLQLGKRTTGANKVEVLALEPRKGFARLPKPNEGDLFFDMEGDPVYSAPDGASLEYLFGFSYLDTGTLRYKAIWARDRASEKKAFEDAVDFITGRIRQYPDAFIYHYASYEETALKRLAQKYGSSVSSVPSVFQKKQDDALKRLAQQYGTRENEVDDLLRGRKLVDLYKVVREGVRTSEPRYSLKNLEVFFAPQRTQEIKEGGDSIVAFERWLVLRDPALLEQIEEYNAFDCRSTMLCRDWLLRVRPSEVEWFDPAKVAAEDLEKEKEREGKRRESDARILAMREALVRGVSDDERPWHELLGYLLEYHRREARSEWWKYFDRLGARVEELIDDADCIGGLRVDPKIPPRQDKRSMVWTLAFPEQELKLGAGDKAVRVDTDELLEIVSLNEAARRLELKVGPTREPLAAEISLIAQGPRDDTIQRDAIARYADAVINDSGAIYSAVTSILRKEKPRPSLAESREPRAESTLKEVIDTVGKMSNSHLVIQGPPGSGKTFTSAHAIVELLKRGKRVGITSLSHKAINNVLKCVEEVAAERRITFKGVKRSNDADQKFNGRFIEEAPDNDAVFAGDYQLIGGTAWLFSRPELDRKLDYLFVDEAGQMSLASVVSTGVCARNIVLVGDQMQLSQPIKGAHPGGSGVSALDYLMGSWATVPPDRGIFLARTWRMHPDLCRFVSDAFYDGRLQAHESTAQQKLILTSDAGGALAPTGLRFVAVEHEDNSQKSVEEAERLNEVYRALLGQCWVNQCGETKAIGVDDVLVVSPYNMQVNLLRKTLPTGARVGTVDKFQGQEAAVVLISMAASSGEHVPRGLEFLFSRNRLNVAISRARCVSLIVAAPTLRFTTCTGIHQMHLVNTLCCASDYGAFETRRCACFV